MQWTQISEQGYYGYMEELEPLFGALGLLIGDRAQDICIRVYGAEQISTWRARYRFLWEAFQAIQNRNIWGVIDFLLDIPMTAQKLPPTDTMAAEHNCLPGKLALDTLTLESYRDYILSLSEEEILWVLLEPTHTFTDEAAAKELLRQALTDDTALDQVYEWVADYCPSFLGFSGFVRQNRRFVRDLFDLALQMRSETLRHVLSAQTNSLGQLQNEVTIGIDHLGELGFSESQLGKTFGNRGPFSEFLFLPTYLMPLQACRFFHPDGSAQQARHSRQILFLSLRQPKRRREDTLKSLKAAADGTRYQILILLAQKGPLRGLDIAREVSLATSTVSHHMDQLKEGGWITEEQVKNSKYYGLNRKNALEFLQGISEDLTLS